MPLAELQSASLYCESEGSGPPLVFAHGAGGNSMSWWQQVPSFASRYTCVTFDHPGFGRSRWSDGASGETEFGGVLGELLDHLDITRCAVVAQSMGGWTAMSLIASRPQMVAALALASTHGGVSTPEIDAATAGRTSRAAPARAAWAERRPDAYNPAVGPRVLRDRPDLHHLYSVISSLNPPR